MPSDKMKIGDVVRLCSDCVPTYEARWRGGLYIEIGQFCLVRDKKIVGKVHSSISEHCLYVPSYRRTIKDIQELIDDAERKRNTPTHIRTLLKRFSAPLKRPPRSMSKFVVVGFTKFNRTEALVIANKFHIAIVKESVVEKVGGVVSIQEAEKLGLIPPGKALQTKFLIDLLADKGISPFMALVALTNETTPHSVYSVRARKGSKTRLEKQIIPVCSSCGIIWPMYDPYESFLEFGTLLTRKSCPFCGRALRRFTSGMSFTLERNCGNESIFRELKGWAIFPETDTTLPLMRFIRFIYNWD